MCQVLSQRHFNWLAQKAVSRAAYCRLSELLSGGAAAVGRAGGELEDQLGSRHFSDCFLTETSILIARWSPCFLISNNDYLGPKYLHDLSTCRLTAANSQPGRMGSECGAQGTRRSRSECIVQLCDYVCNYDKWSAAFVCQEKCYSKFCRSSWEEWGNSASIFKLGRWNGIKMAMAYLDLLRICRIWPFVLEKFIMFWSKSSATPKRS